MITIGQGIARTCAGFTRREFLKVGGVGLGSLGLTLDGLRALGAESPRDERSVILLQLVGGPSQLETWDPKPEAPAEIRGPLGSIPTRVPGVRINECLPGLAARMDRFALVRSLAHDAAPIHETGQQLLQTGRLCQEGEEHPNLGSIATHLLGGRGSAPASVLLPGPITHTGVNIPHGQSAGWLGAGVEPFHLSADPASPRFDARQVLDRARRSLDQSRARASRAVETLASERMGNAFDLGGERRPVREAYGPTTFGQSCLMARRLVESGARLVTVNMFETVFNKVTWDCHGASPFSTLDDYRRVLLPELDRVLSALLDDLHERGLLSSTLVVATGEFGRTPKINAAGGRDHWPGVWSALLAGGGIQGGRVVGASDAHASAPAERPVSPQELLATMYHRLGIDPLSSLAHPSGGSFLLADGAGPIRELFA
jgi:uncharacterized protein (DUF1501 family)